MPSYLVTGASRGIGLSFLENISSNPSNTVIGLVRNIADTKAKIADWNRSNVHIIQGDLTDYDSLKKAVDTVTGITSGSLDYIIANAAIVPRLGQFDSLSTLGQDPDGLTTEFTNLFNTNVVGNVHLFNLFMPLVLKGKVKKVIALSTGLADLDLTVQFDIYENGPYSISKAAMNMAVCKFQAEYKKDGVLFLSISPGAVETGQWADISEEDGKKLMIQGQKFMAYAPDFKGQISTDESAKAVLKVVENASLEKGDAGAFISHHGNKQWL